MHTTLKVCTFNLRTQTPQDGKNDFIYRAPRIRAYLDAEMPDLIGFQEVVGDMPAFLQEALPQYMILGCGRDRHWAGEAPLLAFRRDRFTCIRMENLWLSPTPQCPGSTYGGDQSPCPRIFTAVQLISPEMEKPFTFINTHLDHVGSQARLLEVRQLLDYIDGLGMPVILTGDFNATPDKPEIRALADHPGMVDATAYLSGTFHDYGRLETPIKIDYIFTNASTDPHASCQAQDTGDENGVYLSDHCPVIAYVTL